MSERENRKPLKTTVNSVKVNTDPETTVFQIIVDGGDMGIWNETANTPREVEMFLRGVQAMSCFAGFPVTEIQSPHNSSTIGGGGVMS